MTKGWRGHGQAPKGVTYKRRYVREQAGCTQAARTSLFQDFTEADRTTLRLFAIYRYAGMPVCRSGLVRELPGTGSKDAYGLSGKTELTWFRAASQPIAAVVTS
ncbi:hypothetical protein ALP87_05292 [Pseudomonas syringae pv. coriandricola]|nr:hypothetical protein ALP87_05292 [Pseudomonas syringae pv. coriandricola]